MKKSENPTKEGPSIRYVCLGCKYLEKGGMTRSKYTSPIKWEPHCTYADRTILNKNLLTPAFCHFLVKKQRKEKLIKIENTL